MRFSETSISRLRLEPFHGKRLIKQELIKHVDPRGYVLDQPVESLKQTFTGVSTTAYYLPVPSFIHGFQVQYLLRGPIQENKIKSFIETTYTKELRQHMMLRCLIGEKHQRGEGIARTVITRIGLFNVKQIRVMKCYRERKKRPNY